jgi:hydrogenase maturation protease
MNRSIVEDIVQAVLYEGYILYPYRPSSVKNRQRWTFGGVYPKAFTEKHRCSDACSMQTQCIVMGARDVNVTLRFLHLLERRDAERQVWQEALEREIRLEHLKLDDPPRRVGFGFPSSREIDGDVVRTQEEVRGQIEVSAERHAGDIFVLTVRVNNTTPFEGSDREAALLRAFASTHLILNVPDGQFMSLTDPPESLRELAAACQNVGCWPVLVGEAGESDTMLASPIILEDYPRIAPQSPGNLFDGTEIDEILTLRILTLTDDEKREAVSADGRAAELFARTESLARQQLMDLHGVMRHA